MILHSILSLKKSRMVIKSIHWIWRRHLGWESRVINSEAGNYHLNLSWRILSKSETNTHTCIHAHRYMVARLTGTAWVKIPSRIIINFCWYSVSVFLSFPYFRYWYILNHCIIQELFQKWYLLFISIETITDTGNTITQLDSKSFWL